jgi:excisionase family DNA binding protein
MEILMEQNKKYLNQQEVADILGVKVKTLNHWRAVKRHNIPFIKMGRIILYPTALFYQWLEIKIQNNTAF